ncbi:hypothetical protein ACSV9I_07070 [Rhizobium sp. G187]|uniref:hypothetical protein n=1 Tax=Rhizobium sp. G187 TaxID=3451352 RepID=UPI003EE4E805
MPYNDILGLTCRKISVAALCIIFALSVNGSIPFFTAPTLGQAIWIAGFGYSFSNESILAIHANNMGYPLPSPIAFGLSGAYPSGLLIAAGLNAIDAYTLVVTGWLIIAFIGAAALARIAGTSLITGFLMATMWLCLPAVWDHASYSMTAVGMALMPFYLWSVVRILNSPFQNKIRFALDSLLFAAVCLLSAFTDGYTFVMFAVASSTCIGSVIASKKGPRSVALRLFPVHIASFGIAYILYKSYFPYVDSNLSTLDFFRGWGADITYFFVPTCGVSSFFDYFGACSERISKLHYGDASVWRTTFISPILFASMLFFFWKRPQGWLPFACLAFGLFALYMSLGPTVKLFTVKQPDHLLDGPFMSASQGWFETGSGWISERIPGFASMRASYRWVVLALLGVWLLLASCMTEMKAGRAVTLAVPGLVILLLIPGPANFASARSNRENFGELEKGLVSALDSDLKPGERVAFLPFRNDFLVNYLAPRIGIRAFNIGGDKNLAAAMLNWPQPLLDPKAQQTDMGLAEAALKFLAKRDGDVVIFPYFDMLDTAHKGKIENVYQPALSMVTRQLEKSTLVDVSFRNDYAVARLSKIANDFDADDIVERFLEQQCIGTLCLTAESLHPSNSATQVGEYKGGAIFSTNKKGFLLYGPYVAMNPGEYRLTIRGKANGTAWSDVTSANGQTVLTSAALCTENCPYDKIFDQKFNIATKVERLEIRVFVDAGDNVRVDSYELVPSPHDQR